jgi:hypothetical protein
LGQRNFLFPAGFGILGGGKKPWSPAGPSIAQVIQGIMSLSGPCRWTKGTQSGGNFRKSADTLGTGRTFESCLYMHARNEPGLPAKTMILLVRKHSQIGIAKFQLAETLLMS